MSDHGFDFQKAAERREKGRFEIPPWEQEAFEELQRRRQEESPEAEQGPGSNESKGQGPAASEPLCAEDVSAVEAGALGATGSVAEPTPVVRKVDPAKSAESEKVLSEAEMAALLARLSSEEPSMEKGIGVATMLTAALLLPTGIMLLVWGMGGMVKARAATQSFGPGAGSQMQLAAGTMILFGAGFMVGAMWLVYRYLRQRGVI